jgi:hypothetical protein
MCFGRRDRRATLTSSCHGNNTASIRNEAQAVTCSEPSDDPFDRAAISPIVLDLLIKGAPGNRRLTHR